MSAHITRGTLEGAMNFALDIAAGTLMSASDIVNSVLPIPGLQQQAQQNLWAKLELFLGYFSDPSGIWQPYLDQLKLAGELAEQGKFRQSSAIISQTTLELTTTLSATQNLVVSNPKLLKYVKQQQQKLQGYLTPRSDTDLFDAGARPLGNKIIGLDGHVYAPDNNGQFIAERPATDGELGKVRLKRTDAGRVVLDYVDTFLDSVTPSGDTVYHNLISTAIGDDKATKNNFYNAINTGKGHNVIVHGSLDYDELGGIPTVNDRETNPAQIAEAVRSNPDYVEGTQVCFASCWSGSSGSAQYLADELNAPVYAPTRPVAWDSKADNWVFDTDRYDIEELTRPDIKPGWKMFYPKSD